MTSTGPEPDERLLAPRGRARAGRRGWTPVYLQVGRFALAGLVALGVVALATSVATRRIGEREAIADVRTTTLLKAEGLVRPLVTAQLLAGDSKARAALDAEVRRTVLDGSLVRLKLWSEDGTIVFSDEARLIDTRVGLGAEELEALRTGKIVAETSDLSKPENQYERSFGKLLEVYLPIRAASGERLLFEAYYRADLIDANGRRLWNSFAPIWLGALVLLQLVQVPLAWSLAKNLAQRLRERERLLSRALEASDVERRQIASDLHDGAVQELSGVAFALSGAAMRGAGGPEVAELLPSSAETVRSAIKELRSLIVDIYPPNFAEVSFASALRELLARAENVGLASELRVEVGDLPDPVARLLFRGVQEGVRNVLNHADATTLTVLVRAQRGRVTVEVSDDGQGMAPDVAERRASGHLGLTTLSGLAHDAGGTLELVPNQPRGTTLRLTVPM